MSRNSVRQSPVFPRYSPGQLGTTGEPAEEGNLECGHGAPESPLTRSRQSPARRAPLPRQSPVDEGRIWLQPFVRRPNEAGQGGPAAPTASSATAMTSPLFGAANAGWGIPGTCVSRADQRARRSTPLDLRSCRSSPIASIGQRPARSSVSEPPGSCVNPGPGIPSRHRGRRRPVPLQPR